MSDKVESSLDVDYAVLKRRVGRILGFPDEESAWYAHQLKAANQVISDGLRQYYQPPQVDDFGPHTWSFMYPTKNMSTVADQRWYELPDGFDHLNAAAGMTTSGDNKTYTPIRVTSPSHLAGMEAASAAITGFPRFAAARIIKDRGTSPTKWELGLHPTPDDDYAVQYECYIQPYMLTDERTYPLGGSSHAQGILLSCLAAAESYEYERQGEWYQAFLQQLKADIQLDARRGPSTLGYGGVHRRGGAGDGRWRGRHSPGQSSNIVTYNNTEWD